MTILYAIGCAFLITLPALLFAVVMITILYFLIRDKEISWAYQKKILLC